MNRFGSLICMLWAIGVATPALAQEKPAAVTPNMTTAFIEGARSPTRIEQCDDVAPDASLAEAKLTIANCVALQERGLTGSDDRTRWSSRLSGVAGFGAVASGLAGQGAGTINPWLAVGVTPAIIDDVQQRQNWSHIRRDFLGRVTQLQCRANFLFDNDPRIKQSSVVALRAEALQLDEALWALRARYNPTAATNTPAGQFRLIFEEGVRQLGLARQLLAYVDGLPDAVEISRQRAIAYNALNAELRTFRSETLARPATTLRALMATPFRAASNVIAGTSTTQPTFGSTPAFNAEFKNRFHVPTNVDAASLTALSFVLPALHPERVSAAQQPAARALVQSLQGMSAHGDTVRNAMLTFVRAANEQNPDTCHAEFAPAHPAVNPPAGGAKPADGAAGNPNPPAASNPPVAPTPPVTPTTPTTPATPTTPTTPNG